MDYYVYKTIDYCFEAMTYVNDLYVKYTAEERVLESSYDIETDTITQQYKIDDKVYTLKIDRKTKYNIKDLINDFKSQMTDDKILNATMDGEDITEQLNELCGPSGRHMTFSPIKISYISEKLIENLDIMDDMCIEHAYSYKDEYITLE